MTARTPILLAYCGRARVRLGTPPRDTLAHAYLRMPDDWQDSGVPQRTRGNAVFLGHDIPGIDIGDVFELDEEDGTIHLDRREWRDRVDRKLTESWKRSDRAAAAGKPSEIETRKPDPETEAIGTLRALYFGLPEATRQQWLDRMVQSVTQP